MFITPIFFRPGQQLKEFEVYRKRAALDERGRVTNAAGPELLETFRGTRAQASQSEKYQWNQNGHPITHTIVVRGRIRADAGDELRREGRVWTVQGRHDPVDMGWFTTLYCLERLGVNPTPAPPAGRGEKQVRKP